MKENLMKLFKTRYDGFYSITNARSNYWVWWQSFRRIRFTRQQLPKNHHKKKLELNLIEKNTKSDTYGGRLTSKSVNKTVMPWTRELSVTSPHRICSSNRSTVDFASSVLTIGSVSRSDWPESVFISWADNAWLWALTSRKSLNKSHSSCAALPWRAVSDPVPKRPIKRSINRSAHNHWQTKKIYQKTIKNKR